MTASLNPFVGRWTYRSLLNDQDVTTDFDKLEFGRAWLVPVWPASTDNLETAAMVGSVTRTIPHSSDGGGTSPAGVVASFYAVRQADV